MRLKALGLAVLCGFLSCAHAQTRTPAEVANDALLRSWGSENEACRGGPGDDPATDRACERRERISAQLRSRGLCYGRERESGFRSTWHRCGCRSLGR